MIRGRGMLQIGSLNAIDFEIAAAASKNAPLVLNQQETRETANDCMPTEVKTRRIFSNQTTVLKPARKRAMETRKTSGDKYRSRGGSIPYKTPDEPQNKTH